MKRNTEKNREKLAKEVVDQMDMDTVLEFVKDQLEYQYVGMPQKEFNDVWLEVFGEN